MEDKLLFIDIETGGLNPSEHSLLSLAAVVWDNKEIIDSIELFINDGKLITTDEALAINKIDIEEHKKSSISPTLAIDKLLFFIAKYFTPEKKITIAGHNVHFDIGFLKNLFFIKEKDFSSIFSHRIIDTSSILYYLYLSGYLKQKTISSDAAFKLFNINVDGRHTALGDAMATLKLFNILLDLIKK